MQRYDAFTFTVRQKIYAEEEHILYTGSTTLILSSCQFDAL